MTHRRAIPLLCFLALTGVVHQAHSEVRIVDGPEGLVLAVQPINGNIWVSLDSTRDGVLNAGGDALGDSAPRTGLLESSLAVAWLRQANDTFPVVLATSPSDLSWQEVAADGGVNEPLVLPLRDVAILAWQSWDGSPRVRFAAITPEHQPSTTVTFDGVLSVGLVLGDTAYLVLHDETVRQFQLVRVVVNRDIPFPGSLGVLPLDPIPIPFTGRLRVTSAGAEWWSGHSLRVHTDHAPLGKARAHEPASPAVLALDVCISPDTGTANLTWNAGLGLTGLLELDEVGPIGEPRLVRGLGPPCPEQRGRH